MYGLSNGTTANDLEWGWRSFFQFSTFVIPTTQEIWRVLTIVCLHINLKAHAACDLNFIVKGDRLLKVAGSHVHCKSGGISETVIARDVVTFNSSNFNDLEGPWGHYPIASLFRSDISYLWRVARCLCICRASCFELLHTFSGTLNSRLHLNEVSCGETICPRRWQDRAYGTTT